MQCNACLQVLDAVQFLHHRGIVHLNIQPDNIIMQSRRRFDVKLVDFGLAQKITTIDGVAVDRVGLAEFMGKLNAVLVNSVNPFNASCCKLLLFEGSSAILV